MYVVNCIPKYFLQPPPLENNFVIHFVIKNICRKKKALSSLYGDLVGQEEEDGMRGDCTITVNHSFALNYI